ncbi:SUMF1/EgtB/PvdO family nonheme iron enzyme [Nocardiopsis sp. HNM0947]|uniref:SUMF1/EgtB/PvdO family nonheme iron enzyme n=1 Tax=Nocardiopsis coralli TaxID=2772213 RepID=A0ABR9PB88_9ACTN|nr:SUMF1/EgtB/PvdO family nonheme iron enzyme [Nocardiopsis coralli]MBE3001107.1 SUMF1/EgtB/PvdO family nonheme iron enzyme [Nocardiopsis coralli]
MVAVPAGEVALQDRRAGTAWEVEVRPFALAAVPVTRGLYREVMERAVSGRVSQAHGDEPVQQVPDRRGSGHPFSGDRDEETGPGDGVPITEVSWFDSLRFCDLLSHAHGLEPCYGTSGRGRGPDGEDVRSDPDAGGYRLPTEAEWEHACRAGDSAVRYGDLDTIAWHRKNSGGRPQGVGGREPNAWGLHDMIGNVWEWCWDFYDPRVYGPYRVFRGGGWNDRHWGCQASARRKSHPTLRIDDLGFRVARSL